MAAAVQPVQVGTGRDQYRVGDDDLYYGGTSYDNKSGIGLQWPSAADNTDASVEMYELTPPAGAPAAGTPDGHSDNGPIP